MLYMRKGRGYKMCCFGAITTRDIQAFRDYVRTDLCPLMYLSYGVRATSGHESADGITRAIHRCERCGECDGRCGCGCECKRGRADVHESMDATKVTEAKAKKRRGRKQSLEKAAEGDRYRAYRVRGDDADLGDDGRDARWRGEVVKRVQDLEVRPVLERERFARLGDREGRE